jgi:hypothetical protein
VKCTHELGPLFLPHDLVDAGLPSCRIHRRRSHCAPEPVVLSLLTVEKLETLRAFSIDQVVKTPYLGISRHRLLPDSPYCWPMPVLSC